MKAAWPSMLPALVHCQNFLSTYLSSARLPRLQDLKDRLKKLGLSLSGRKVELIDRLREALGHE